MPRRERTIILAEILISLKERNPYGNESASFLAARANVPYDRLQGYLQDLMASGLAAHDGSHTHITARGLSFLHEYESWREVLHRFGLHPDLS